MPCERALRHLRTELDTGDATSPPCACGAEERGGVDRVLGSSRLPWGLLSVMALFFWVAESYLHAFVFGNGRFLAHLLSPAPHEAWMRVLVVFMLLIVAAAWSQALRIRQHAFAQARDYERRLGEASTRIAYGDSEERRELADRLHEQVAQTLAAARYFLASVDESTCGEDGQEALRSVGRIIERAVAECREIAQVLSPPALDEYGLGPALEALADRVMRQTGASIQVEGERSTPPLSREALLATFQVLAEIVESVASNTANQGVRICSQWDERALDVTVFCPSVAQVDLFGARERMSGVGGSLARTDGAGGPAITVRTPLSAA